VQCRALHGTCRAPFCEFAGAAAALRRVGLARPPRGSASVPGTCQSVPGTARHVPCTGRKSERGPLVTLPHINHAGCCLDRPPIHSAGGRPEGAAAAAHQSSWMLSGPPADSLGGRSSRGSGRSRASIKLDVVLTARRFTRRAVVQRERPQPRPPKNGQGEIRTPDTTKAVYSISNAAPSTARTPVLEGSRSVPELDVHATLPAGTRTRERAGTTRSRHG
jgi:hypothetical protein